MDLFIAFVAGAVLGAIALAVMWCALVNKEK